MTSKRWLVRKPEGFLIYEMDEEAHRILTASVASHEVLWGRRPKWDIDRAIASLGLEVKISPVPPPPEPRITVETLTEFAPITEQEYRALYKGTGPRTFITNPEPNSWVKMQFLAGADGEAEPR